MSERIRNTVKQKSAPKEEMKQSSSSSSGVKRPPESSRHSRHSQHSQHGRPAGASASASASGSSERKTGTSEFQCKMQFENPLPLGIADGKMLDVPLDPREWLVAYRTTALEAKFRFDIYPTSSVLSLPLAFVDPQSYTPAPATTPATAPGAASTTTADAAPASPPASAAERRARDEEAEGGESDEEDAAARERNAKRRRRHGDAENEADGEEVPAELASAEALADAIEEGFAAAAREDVAREPRLLAHPQRAGVHAVDVTPLRPCAAVAGLQVCALHFEADPLDNVGTARADDLGRRRKALAASALVARVGASGKTLALVAAEPPRAPVAAADGARLLPYGTVRLFKQKKSAADDACGERATAAERSVALLARRDARTGRAALEYFDLGDIVTLTRVTDRALVRSVLGDHGQAFYVREQALPQALQDDHDEALAALYATAEQR